MWRSLLHKLPCAGEQAVSEIFWNCGLRGWIAMVVDESDHPDTYRFEYFGNSCRRIHDEFDRRRKTRFRRPGATRR